MLLPSINRYKGVLIQVLLANTSSALNISKILAEHSENKILSGDEIICGLIYRLMVPMRDEEITESMNTANELMYVSSSEEEESEYVSSDKSEEESESLELYDTSSNEKKKNEEDDSESELEFDELEED